MKIPETVKVGGTIYEVRIVDCVNNDSFLAGVCNSNFDYIEIIRNCSDSFKEKTFIHELLHAIFEHCHFDQNEDTVEALSQALYMVIVDNPGIFEN